MLQYEVRSLHYARLSCSVASDVVVLVQSASCKSFYDLDCFRGKFASLENISCKIKPGCKEHPPWPGGICTKCQPNAVTLQRQVKHFYSLFYGNLVVLSISCLFKHVIIQ